ncbi:MAG: hypothetical protein AB1414_13890 [bacterium]
MKKVCVKNQKGLSLITVILISAFLLALGLGLISLIRYDLKMFHRSMESKFTQPLSESGMSQGLWRVLWGEDGNFEGQATPPNGIPDILEKICGINDYASAGTYSYVFTVAYQGLKDVVIGTVTIERAATKEPEKEGTTVLELPDEPGNIVGEPVIADVDNDGIPEIYVATQNGKIYKVVSTGDGYYEVEGEKPFITLPQPEEANHTLLGAPLITEINGKKVIIVATSNIHPPPNPENIPVEDLDEAYSTYKPNFIYAYDALTGNPYTSFDNDQVTPDGKVELNSSLIHHYVGNEGEWDITVDDDVDVTWGLVRQNDMIVLTAHKEPNERCEEPSSWANLSNFHIMGLTSSDGYVIALDDKGDVRWIYDGKSTGDEFDGKESHIRYQFVSKPKFADVIPVNVNSAAAGDEVIAFAVYGKVINSCGEDIIQKRLDDERDVTAARWVKGKIFILDKDDGKVLASQETGWVDANMALRLLQPELGLADIDNSGDPEILFFGGSGNGIDKNNPDGGFGKTDKVGDWMYILNPDDNTAMGAMGTASNIRANYINPGVTNYFHSEEWGYPARLVSHHAPLVIDRNGDNKNDTIVAGTDLGSLMVIPYTQGNFNINNDDDAITSEPEVNFIGEILTPGNTFGQYLDTFSGAMWLDVDNDGENELVWGETGGSTYPSKILYSGNDILATPAPDDLSHYVTEWANVNQVTNEAMGSNDVYGIWAPPVPFVDSDGYQAAVFGTSDFGVPDNIIQPSQRGALIFMNTNSLPGGGRRHLLKITSTVPMLENTVIKKMIAYVSINSYPGDKKILMKSKTVEDIGW